jgi:hypothetical protein
MISYWYYMGFVVNQVRGADGQWFPYFTEQERNNAAFAAAAVAVGDASNVVTGADTNFSNAWYLAPRQQVAPTDALTAAEKPSKPAGQGVAFGSSRQRGRRSLRED